MCVCVCVMRDVCECVFSKRCVHPTYVYTSLVLVFSHDFKHGPQLCFHIRTQTRRWLPPRQAMLVAGLAWSVRSKTRIRSERRCILLFLFVTAHLNKIWFPVNRKTALGKHCPSCVCVCVCVCASYVFHMICCHKCLRGAEWFHKLFCLCVCVCACAFT